MEVKRATPISLRPAYIFHDLRAQGLRVRELPLRTEEAPETDRDILGRLPIKRAQQESFDRDLIAAEGRANSRIRDGIPASARIKVASFGHIDTPGQNLGRVWTEVERRNGLFGSHTVTGDDRPAN